MASLWIIDGFNFIRQSRRFAELEAYHPEKGRAATLKWLNQFAELTGERVCVVLDAYSSLEKNPRAEGFGLLQVVHSRSGYTADEEIIALAEQRREGAIVVSSDQAIIRAVVKAGASFLESFEFEREVAKILEKEEAEQPARRVTKGNAFQAPKEKKKALHMLRKHQ